MRSKSIALLLSLGLAATVAACTGDSTTESPSPSPAATDTALLPLQQALLQRPKSSNSKPSELLWVSPIMLSYLFP
ncbi:MAG: hypothetical protein HC934_01215 [Acaryochloridaceae cyanobacterium SU_2_1]|nr:hypothetical protein [Acaryochloridaceae cyanobacterium SU_2_1]